MAGTNLYSFHTWSGGWYGGTMFSGFGLALATTTPILQFRTTNLYGVRWNAPYAAAINETSTFRAMTWGFDLNMLDAAHRQQLLGDALQALGLSRNQAPVAVCQNVTLNADAQCQASGTIDNGSYDPDGANDIDSISLAPAGPFALGGTLATLTITDQAAATDSCSATVTVVDVTAPTIDCNAPATITPPGAPLSYTATTQDNCSATVNATSASCWFVNGAGKVIDKTKSCGVTVSGASVTIPKSNGVGTTIEWTVVATDSSGNVTQETCSVVVAIPGKAKGNK